MKIVVRNGHAVTVEIIDERAGVRRTMEPGRELVVEWVWDGLADLTCGVESLTWSVPDGGAVTVTEPDPGTVHHLWNSVPVTGDDGVREFRVHNATGRTLDTFWEPWCGEADVPFGAGPMRVRWTAGAAGAGLIFEPGRLVLWDCNGGFRAWQPCGTEIFTGGMPLSRPGQPSA